MAKEQRRRIEIIGGDRHRTGQRLQWRKVDHPHIRSPEKGNSDPDRRFEPHDPGRQANHGRGPVRYDARENAVQRSTAPTPCRGTSTDDLASAVEDRIEAALRRWRVVIISSSILGVFRTIIAS